MMVIRDFWYPIPNFQQKFLGEKQKALKNIPNNTEQKYLPSKIIKSEFIKFSHYAHKSNIAKAIKLKTINNNTFTRADKVNTVIAIKEFDCIVSYIGIDMLAVLLLVSMKVVDSWNRLWSL